MAKLPLANYIEHTNLKPEATQLEIKALAMEAVQYKLFGICVNPVHVPFAVEFLRSTNLRVISVVGFPLGAMPTELKANEAAWIASHGGHEVDMVLNIGALKSKDYDLVRNDIQVVKVACGPALLKVILETALLTAEEIKKATELAVSAGADFIKTSTGFSTRGAAVEDITIIRAALGKNARGVGIKAAGGINSVAGAQALIDAGATRIGTSRGAALIHQVGSTLASGY